MYTVGIIALSGQILFPL